MPIGEPLGQGWTQIAALLTALVLSSLIGLEREVRQKSAGLRTHALVGVGAALFMLISKYGFSDVLEPGRVVLDPSRVAAQIVSGIGFIGGGLIFVRRDAVRGLTTAAVVWVTAAVGAACGAGLPVLAVIVTGAHFLVVYGYSPLVRWLTRSQPASATIRVSYLDGRGVLRDLLQTTTEQGFAVAEAHTEHPGAETGFRRGQDNGRGQRDEHDATAPEGSVSVRLRVVGTGPVNDLAAALSEVDGVCSVNSGEVADASE